MRAAAGACQALNRTGAARSRFRGGRWRGMLGPGGTSRRGPCREVRGAHHQWLSRPCWEFFLLAMGAQQESTRLPWRASSGTQQPPVGRPLESAAHSACDQNERRTDCPTSIRVRRRRLPLASASPSSGAAGFAVERRRRRGPHGSALALGSSRMPRSSIRRLGEQRRVATPEHRDDPEAVVRALHHADDGFHLEGVLAIHR